MRTKLIGVICLFLTTLWADDGMWMPHQMKILNLEEKGLEINPDDLYKMDGTGLMSAIVSLGGGTGEFVSSDGLILTNHHVAFGALQRAATPELDYIENGFLAHSRAEEISAPGYVADVLLGYEEITNQIISALSDTMSYFEKYKMIERTKNGIIAAAEKEATDLHCRIESMYSGNQYYLYKFKRLPDVRIVYAPPRDLGNFGGDIDNWMWPRHTADFAFLRAYVSPENIGVEYSSDNVPYRPKAFLKISTEDVDEGDFTFVMGYPGQTYRNYTVSEIRSDIHRMEKRIGQFEEVINFYEQAGERNKEVEIKYARKVRGLNNALKNYRGKLEGFQKNNILSHKEEEEREIINFFGKSNKTAAIKSVKDLEAFMQNYEIFDEKYQILNSLVNSYYGPSLLAQAHLIIRSALERQKPDLEREEIFQERNKSRLNSRIELAERGYDLNTDKLYFEHILNKLLNNPDIQLPEFLEDLQAEKVTDFIEDLYERSKIKNAGIRLKYIDMSIEELRGMGDPILDFVLQLEEQLAKLRDNDNAKMQEREDLKKPFVNALLESKKGHFATDANGTIRFTYGNVEGYTPRDAVWYGPQTTLQGVVEKNRNEFPFHVPTKLQDLYTQHNSGNYIDVELGDVPVCFLNTTNVTGGNSGSPTLNSKGEQIGIIFDMTYESVIGDYFIIPDLQRTISVDILYVLFITDKFAGADHIIKELGIR